MTTNDLAARMQKLAVNPTQTQTASRRMTTEEARTADGKSFEAQEAADMKNNGIYQIMAKTNMSSDEQINAIAEYLTVKNDDYTSGSRRFAEFQAYFNYVQNEGMNGADIALWRDVQYRSNRDLCASMRRLRRFSARRTF